MTRRAHPDLPPTCECCGERYAVGPLTRICAPCYADLTPRIREAASFRSEPLMPRFRGHLGTKEEQAARKIAQ